MTTEQHILNALVRIEAILDERLPEPEGVNVTEEPPVGSQVTDKCGNVLERREDGWRLWLDGLGIWDKYRDSWERISGYGASVHLTTDADRERVGLPVKAASEPAPTDDHTSDGRCKYPKTCESEGTHDPAPTGEPVEPGDLRAGDKVEVTWLGERIACTLVSDTDDPPGEPVGPGDLRAGDRVAFTWEGTGERIACTLEGHQDGNVLRSGTPDRNDYYPNVTLHGREWCAGISDVRLIERAPREDPDDSDAFYWMERAEEAERRVDELEPALARSETERDEWKAKHAALRAAVQVMLAHAEPDSLADLRLRRILDRDAARALLNPTEGEDHDR